MLGVHATLCEIIIFVFLLLKMLIVELDHHVILFLEPLNTIIVIRFFCVVFGIMMASLMPLIL